MTEITQVRVRFPKRFPGYPTNGRMPTKWMVELGGDKRWRRVYDRVLTPARYEGRVRVPAEFWPVVLDGTEYRDLTPRESALVGYSFEEARSRPPEATRASCPKVVDGQYAGGKKRGRRCRVIVPSE